MRLDLVPVLEVQLRFVPTSGARAVFGGAVVLHAIWALLLSLPDGGIEATPLGWVRDGPGFGPAAAIFLSVAILATVAQSLRLPPAVRLALLVPQQVALLLSASSAVTAVLEGHYADGVPRPWQFILADQLPIVILAVLHTLALNLTFGPRVRSRLWRA